MAALQKMQPLADALALEFSQGQADAQCTSALTRLLPHLAYRSISVSNPAAGGDILAASWDCGIGTADAPMTLHLHDRLASAAGLAMAGGRLLQGSLLEPATARAVAGWTDVQHMVQQTPGLTHMLCLPFGCPPSGANGGGQGTEDGNVDGSSSRSSGSWVELHASQHHAAATAAVGAVQSGALLLGFSASPSLDARRIRLLTLLAQCLPQPMSCAAEGALSFANFASGTACSSSCCCCDADEGSDGDEEEEEASQPGSPCRRSGGSGGPRPDQPAPLLVRPIVGVAAGAERAAPHGDDEAGPSRAWAARDEDVTGGKTRSKGAARAEAAAAAAQPTGCVSPRTGSHRGFSKALLAAATEDGNALRQRPLVLTFRSPQMEEEYGLWSSAHYVRADMQAFLLTLLALLVIAFGQPYCLIQHAPWAIPLGTGLAGPLLLAWLRRDLYTAWREPVLVAYRLYVIAFVNLSCMRSYQSGLAPEGDHQWVAFLRLSGAESLMFNAISFPIALRRHLPLQALAAVLTSSHLASLCSQCYAAVETGTCLRVSTALTIAFGCLLPTLGLRSVEQRSRATFSRLLRSAAAMRVGS